jgi:hypothetical protein
MVNQTQEGPSHTSRSGVPDLYFSCDVEADGPVPGPYSLVSIGLSCVASFDGAHFERRDPRADIYYAELQPISELWVPDALAVSGLTREHLLANGRRPEEAMPELAAWVRGVARGFKPVFVAYPLGYDWMFAYWYLVQFGDTPGKIDNSPFGFSSAVDMKSIYSTKAGTPVGWSTKGRMPEHLIPSSPHTHNALDDAVEQGELFCNLMQWPGA